MTSTNQAAKAKNDTGSAPRSRNHKRAAAAAGTAIAVLIGTAVALGRDDSETGGGAQINPEDVAVAYQTALNNEDARRACELETPRLRGGRGNQPQSIDSCIAEKQAEYATGPDVEAGPVARVGSTSPLTQGVGVAVRYTIPTAAAPQDYALRVVEQDGAWLVDQYETIGSDEQRTSDPIKAALDGSLER